MVYLLRLTDPEMLVLREVINNVLERMPRDIENIFSERLRDIQLKTTNLIVKSL